MTYRRPTVRVTYQNFEKWRGVLASFGNSFSSAKLSIDAFNFFYIYIYIYFFFDTHRLDNSDTRKQFIDSRHVSGSIV